MKVLIFGTGNIARTYARILSNHPSASLVGFVGRTPSTCRKFENFFNVTAYPDCAYQEAIEHSKPDAIIIATPEWERLAPIKCAVDSSLPILIEKPLADNWKDAQLVVNLLSTANARFMPCHVLRFSPRFVQVKKLIAKNVIGSIVSIHSRRNSNSLRAKRVIHKTNLAYWLYPHDLDLTRWFLGCDASAAYALQNTNQPIETNGIQSLITYENGVTAVHEVSWASPPSNSTLPEISYELRGTDGTIYVEDSQQSILVSSSKEFDVELDTYEEFEVSSQWYGFFRYMLDDFILKCQHSRFSGSSLYDITQVIKTCEMISRSIQAQSVCYRDSI